MNLLLKKCTTESAINRLAVFLLGSGLILRVGVDAADVTGRNIPNFNGFATGKRTIVKYKMKF